MRKHGAHAERAAQRVAPGTTQPVGRRFVLAAGIDGAVRRVRVHQREQFAGDGQFVDATAARQAFDRMQRRVLRIVAFGAKRRRLIHQLHQCADLADQLPPLRVSQQTQRRDRAADAHVVRGLFGLLLYLRGGGIRQYRRERRAYGFAFAIVFEQSGAGVGVQALKYLQSKRAKHASRTKDVEYPVDVDVGVVVQPIAPQVRQRARGLRCRDALGQTPQIFDQYDAHRRRQRPQFTQCQIACLLIGTQVCNEQRFVERAVGVCDECPRDAVDTRQAGQMCVDQNGQVAEVAARQAVVNLFDLRNDDVEIVEQPFAGGADVIPGTFLYADVSIGLAQHGDVVAQARKKLGRPRCVQRCGVCFAETAAVFLEAAGAENLRADRWFDDTTRRIQNRQRLCAGMRHVPAQASVFHRIQTGNELPTNTTAAINVTVVTNLGARNSSSASMAHRTRCRRLDANAHWRR